MDWKILYRRSTPEEARYCGWFAFIPSLSSMVTWVLLEFVF